MKCLFQVLQQDVPHNLETGGIGMHVVVGIGATGREIEAGEIVYEFDMLRLGICLQLRIDVLHRFGDISGFGTPADEGGGGKGAKDWLDAVGPGKFAHADDIVYYLLGTQGDDVAAHPAEDLRGALAGDAAVKEIVVGEEVGVGVFPNLGDGIAQKDGLGPHGDLGVLFFVPFCIGEIGVLRECAQAAEHHRNKE